MFFILARIKNIQQKKVKMNIKSSLATALIAAVVMTGCSDSRSEASYVATEMCGATKDLDFDRMRELSASGYVTRLNRIEQAINEDESRMEEIHKELTDLDCGSFVKKQGKHNEVFKFKNGSRNMNINVFKPDGEDIYYVRTML